jgi:hypothetical protein
MSAKLIWFPDGKGWLDLYVNDTSSHCNLRGFVQDNPPYGAIEFNNNYSQSVRFDTLDEAKNYLETIIRLKGETP